MTNKVLLVSILFLASVFCGCGRISKTAEDRTSVSPQIELTEDNPSEYFTQAPLMQTREKELSQCLFDAARQISMRKKVAVKYIVFQDKTEDGKMWKKTNVILDYDQTNSIAILEKMTVLSVTQTDNGTEARILFEGKSEFTIPDISSIDTTRGRDTKPDWIQAPPAGKLFFSAVGSIHQVSKRSEAVTNADINAIGAIAEQISIPLVTGNTMVYETVLYGVYIAQRWFDPAEKRYYSLAILPR